MALTLFEIIDDLKERTTFDFEPLTDEEISVLDLIVKAYDIRGYAPEQLSAKLAYRLGVGFSQWLDQIGEPNLSVAVGRDVRSSGIDLSGAFALALIEQGRNVIDLGLIATDELYYASGSLDCAGAVFTASHNPAEYNGIKLCGRQAAPVSLAAGLDVVKTLAIEPLLGLEGVTELGTLEPLDVLPGYVSHVLSLVDTSKLKPLRVVVDTANGIGGLTVPAAFDHLDFDVEYMYRELDGTFPNHPADPIKAENVADLCKRVVSNKADIGLAFDGDADRVFIIDDQGRPLSGSITTAMVAKSLLERNPGATVLHNLICSRIVAETVQGCGGKAIRTRVGHSFIKAKMAETGAVFAGEHSGHYYFLENYRADSGLIAALLVLELLSRSDAPLSEIRSEFDKYFSTGEINTHIDDAERVLDVVYEYFSQTEIDAELAQVDRLDGLTVSFTDWWFNVRLSNTEPGLARLNLEASTQSQMDRGYELVKSLIDSATS